MLYKIILPPFMVLSFISRLLLVIYAIYNNQIAADYLVLTKIFGYGVIADFICFCYIIVPIYAVLLLLPQAGEKAPQLPQKEKSYSKQLLYYLCIFSLCFNVAAEYIFWGEFGARFNFIAVDYLVYTREVIGNIRESYNLFLIIPVLLFFSFILERLFAWLCNLNNAKLSVKEFAVSVLIAGMLFYSYKPLTIKGNRYHSELSKNGVYNLFHAYRNNSIKYDKFYKRIGGEKLFTNLRGLLANPHEEFVSPASLDITRHVKAKSTPRHYNVILIAVESLSAAFLERYGNQSNITPFLNNLIHDSLNFTNYYATGTRTVRGLESMTLSIPPTPGTSLVRKPNNENLFSLGGVLHQQGYQNKFIYGGFGYFDNMEYFFSNNHFQVLDRNMIPENEISFSNIWGVSDEDLFHFSLQEADKSYDSQNPFFFFIMTTSNHRPFTYPDGRIDIPSGNGRAGAVKYSDYAIGKFIEQAREKPWYKDTIFVITADHCASSAAKTKIDISKYHIPLLIYAPHIVKAREVNQLSSQIDLAPTILSLLNISYDSKFFGSSILEAPKERAFVATYQLLGLLANKELVILKPKEKAEIYTIENGEYILQQHSSSKLIEDAISYYQGADYLFHNGLMKE